jgi:hypothetical protein
MIEAGCAEIQQARHGRMQGGCALFNTGRGAAGRLGQAIENLGLTRYHWRIEMGVLGNHLFKTAIKRNLADLVEGVAALQHSQEDPVSFGEAVMLMSRHEYYQSYLESGELAFGNWEQCFFSMVMLETKREVGPDRSLLYGTKDYTTVVDLVSRTIIRYGGDPDEILNLYSDSDVQGHRAGGSEIHPCPFCQTKVRIPVPPPAPQARCKGCNSQFRISFDGTRLSLSK